MQHDGGLWCAFSLLVLVLIINEGSVAAVFGFDLVLIVTDVYHYHTDNSNV